MRRNFPLFVIGSVFSTMLILSLCDFGIRYFENKSELERLMALPRISVGALAEQVESGQAVWVERSHLDSGNWFRSDSVVVFESEDQHGKKTMASLPQDLAVDEITKPLYAAIGKSTLRLSAGFNESRPSVLTIFSSFVFLIGIFLTLMIFGQGLVGEFLSRHACMATRPDRSVLFRDVIGHEEVKEELQYIQKAFETPEGFAERGLQPPKGILMCGDPGVGKTLLAKALANEMNAAFYSVAASDFVELYVGMGAKRVRNLFRTARQQRRAVIFIDEFDAIGNRDDKGGDSERRSTLNALLTELDGMNKNGNLLVLAATNRVEHIDPALKRPGRFDKIVRMNLPDHPTRVRILQHYCHSVRVGPDVDYQILASRTAGCAGAGLREIVEEAKRVAWKAQGSPTHASRSAEEAKQFTQEIEIRNEHFVLAQENLALGPGKNILHPSEVERVTVHELGHALVGHLRCGTDVRIEKVTIEGRGASLGYTLTSPLDERRLRTRSHLFNEITMLLGGRAAEDVILGNVSSGARDDLERANRIATTMVTELGMGEVIGLRTWNASAPGAVLPEPMSQEIGSLLETAYGEAKHIINQHRDWVLHQAQALRQWGVRTRETLFETPEAQRLLATSSLPTYPLI